MSNKITFSINNITPFIESLPEYKKLQDDNKRMDLYCETSEKYKSDISETKQKIIANDERLKAIEIELENSQADINNIKSLMQEQSELVIDIKSLKLYLEKLEKEDKEHDSKCNFRQDLLTKDVYRALQSHLQTYINEKISKDIELNKAISVYIKARNLASRYMDQGLTFAIQPNTEHSKSTEQELLELLPINNFWYQKRYI